MKLIVYLKEHKLSGAVISLSGGIDSSVTTILLQKVCEIKDSNLKKIYVVNQPIHSSKWSIDRSEELCKKFNIDLIMINQTDIHDILIKKDRE